MERSTLQRLRPGRLFVWLAIGAGAALLISSRDRILSGLGVVVTIGPVSLVACIALVALGILNRGAQAAEAYRLAGLSARMGAMVKLSAASFATNKVIRAGGVAGIAPFLSDANRCGNSRTRVAAAYASSRAADSIAVCGLIVVAGSVAVVGGALRGAELAGVIGSLVYASAVGGLLVALFRRPSTAEAVLAWLSRLTENARARFRRPARAHGSRGRTDVLEVIERVRTNPAVAAPLLLSAMVGKLISVAGLAVVLIGLGIHLGIPAILLVYTLTIMASGLGPLPGGIGLAEASLAALLVAHGVASSVAAGAVLGFRLFDTWIPFLIGAAATGARPRRWSKERAAHKRPCSFSVPSVPVRHHCD